MSNLLPILKNFQELDKQKGRGLFVEILFGHNNTPFIMYGEDHGTHMTYTAVANDEANTKIKNEAVKNLEKLDVPMELQSMNGITIVTASHEYAAEKILDRSFMRKVCEKLNSKVIMVGIPMKGFMVAVASGPDEGKVFGAVGMQYDNAETYPISKALYRVIDGEIEMVATNDDSDSQVIKNENGILDVVGQNDGNGKIGFVIKLGDKNEAEITNKIQTAFQNIILQAVKDSQNFNGKIDYHISPEYNALTPSLEAQLKKVAKNISERGAVQLLGGLSGEAFKVRFFYGQNKLIAETIETKPVQLKESMAAKKSPQQTDKSKINQTTQKAKKPWWKFW